jgi:NTE family protein
MKKSQTPAEAVLTGGQRPRLGLALSGGGFRASLFHIGLLARLAERGLLRKVEVISSVSGGSILSALYYIHVKLLLESVPDAEVTDAHYLQIVQKLYETFPKTVERNLRGQAFLNPIANFKMALPGHSRTDRFGELYDRWFYRPALGGSGPIPMSDLLIHPAGHDGPFNPDNHNAARNAPVPILLLNATTLNTGHMWRFEAMYLGEPALDNPAANEVDVNSRLARTTYATLGKDFPLGKAVAASAAFPGLVRPLEIRNLYARTENGKQVKLTLELMDGGAHDNQGVESLIDRSCTHLIISDAGGLMGDSDAPNAHIPGVLRRAYDVASDRMREEQLQEALRLEATAFVHLQKGLPTRVLNPIGTQPPETEEPPEFPSTAFGVDPKVQWLVSSVRTDLDGFSEIESHTLMCDAYNMIEAELNVTPDLAQFAGEPVPPPAGGWPFLSIAPWLAKPTAEFLKQLTTAKKTFFKPASLSLPLLILTIALAVAALGGAVYGAVCLYSVSTQVPPFWILIGVVLSLVGLLAYVMPDLPGLGMLSGPLYDRLWPGLLAPVLPLFSLLMVLSGRLFLGLGKQSKLGTPPG